MAANKKLVSTIAAVATSAALLLGGTLAWQSANQTALNEASDVVNPGGRLHDDFYIDDNGDYNADIYVENFAEEDIFARVKLQEYMEVIMNYGTAGEKNYLVLGEQLDIDPDDPNPPINQGTRPDDTKYEREYVTHTSYTPSTGYKEIAGVDQKKTSDNYWTWTMGSTDSEQVYYMPTFNMNKDSLVADRNGMYVDRIGGISNRGQEQYYTDDRTAPSWTVWTENATKDSTEIWDVDYNDADEVGYSFESLDQFVADGNIETIGNTHTAQPVGTTNGFISMTDWLKKLSDGENTADYWVYDEDDSGWIYWSSPIEGGTATGLLLDSIELNDVMDDTWYYAINAIGQFVTADDVGKTDGTGFYAEGEAPTADAETLLEAIGVDMGGEEEGPQTYDLLLNWNEDNKVYAKPNDRIVLSVEPYTFTDEETGEETVYTGDLSSVTLYDTDTDDELTKDADYLYDPVTFTLIVTNDQISGVRVVEAEGNLGGYVYFTDSGEDDPEIIDQPLDIYVVYEDGTIAGTQPTDPSTDKQVEGVIQIFAIGIEKKPMYLGSKLTTENGETINSRTPGSNLTVKYELLDYDARMATTWSEEDSGTENYTFNVVLVDDASSDYNGYYMATAIDSAGKATDMVALHPENGHLLMLAEEQPINQNVLVRATTTYNGKDYTSNDQQLFFVNRDINIHMDVDEANIPGGSYTDGHGVYTSGTEAVFNLDAYLLIENKSVGKPAYDDDTNYIKETTDYPLTWKVTDEGGNECSDMLTVDQDAYGKATLTIPESASAARYTVTAAYVHTADDGKNKGIYSARFDVYEENSLPGGEEGGEEDPGYYDDPELILYEYGEMPMAIPAGEPVELWTNNYDENVTYYVINKANNPNGPYGSEPDVAEDKTIIPISGTIGNESFTNYYYGIELTPDAYGLYYTPKFSDSGTTNSTESIMFVAMDDEDNIIAKASTRIYDDTKHTYAGSNTNSDNASWRLVFEAKDDYDNTVGYCVSNASTTPLSVDPMYPASVTEVADEHSYSVGDVSGTACDGDHGSKVTGAMLYSDAVVLTEVSKGRTYNLSVKVGNEVKNVTSWKVVGNRSSGTSFNGDTLSIGYFEDATELTILATIKGETFANAFTVGVSGGNSLTELADYKLADLDENEFLNALSNQLFPGAIISDVYVVSSADLNNNTTLNNAVLLNKAYDLSTLEVVGSDPGILDITGGFVDEDDESNNVSFGINEYDIIAFRTADYWTDEPHSLYVIAYDNSNNGVFVKYTFATNMESA